MSSPSPGPLGAQHSVMTGGMPTRRVSANSYIGIVSGTGVPSNQSTAQPARALTPPIAQQHSPNSFLAGLSSRLMSNKSRIPQEIMEMSGGSLANSSNFLGGFRGNSGMHNFGVVGGSVGGPPPLDLSEFPSLGGHNSNTLLTQSASSGRPAYVGMVKDNTTNNNVSNEFNIQSEDFPALPGSNPNIQFGSTHHENSTMSSASTAMSLGVGNMNATGSMQGMQSSFSGAGDGMSKIKRGIQTNKDGRVTNIPPGMVTDQFGMVGLLTFIRAAETDPNMVSLALGTDLTTLGLNLNSSEPLYSTYAGPWSDQTLKPPEIDYPVPSEYLINHAIRDKLAPIKIKLYGDDLLFFLFYMYPGDVIQALAASELYMREWRYHKDERIWITRAPGVGPQEKTTLYERGTYFFFDPQHWRKVAKEFHLEYDRLENRPVFAALQSSLQQ